MKKNSKVKQSMEAETFHLPLTWSAYEFPNYLDCQLRRGKQEKKIWCKYVSSGTCLLNCYCILLQVFDTPPKLNVSHSTETNSSQRGGVWFEGSCLISLSVTQNKCWLVAESNFEKKIQSSTQKYSTPSKLQNEIKKKYCGFKVLKMFLFEKIVRNVRFNSLLFRNS